MGLTPRGSQVYLGLLQSGAQGVSDIARRSKLTRVMVYAVLEELMHEGLVVVHPKGKYKVYAAAPPRKLEDRFVQLSNKFDEHIAALSALSRSGESVKPIVEYSEGREAIKAIYDDVAMSLNPGDTYYRYSSTKVRNGEREGGTYISKKYRLLRNKKQLERLVITNEQNKNSKLLNLDREVKVVPPDFDLFEYNVSQVIYGDKVAVIDYNTETATVIQNKTVAMFQKKIFELLWRKL
jgi:sugar-specific transcriptional regulator TrmB